MDKATIEAMRKVIRMLGDRKQYIQKLVVDTKDNEVHLYGSVMPAREFYAGVEGFRTLLDQAEAEQSQAPAEPDDRDVLARFTEDLEDAVIAAKKDRTSSVDIRTINSWVAWTPEKISAVVRAINGLMDAKPTTTGEPTLDECVAAINRAGHRGCSDWGVELYSRSGMAACLNWDEFIGLGRLLIDRERAEAAKGGA